MKGPSPARVSTRPAAFTAATNVVWSAEFTVFSTMFLSANISAPPTMGFFISSAKAAPAVRARAAVAVIIFLAKVMVFSSVYIVIIW